MDILALKNTMFCFQGPQTDCTALKPKSWSASYRHARSCISHTFKQLKGVLLRFCSSLSSASKNSHIGHILC